MNSSGPNDTGSWTVLKTLNWTTDYFQRKAIESPRIDAEILLAHTLGCDRINLYVRHDQPLNGDELAGYKRLITRRAAFEPVAYITGVKEFWSLPFQVTPDVLIPRPDTERLVEAAIDHLAASGSAQSARILELGVGSGAITIAVAHEFRQGRYWATDRSPRAVSVARGNARRNGVEASIHFMVGDWFMPLSPEHGKFDLIMVNPPYIPSADIEKLSNDIKEFEPFSALDGGQDGLDDIKKIIEQSYRYLRPGGVVMVEIGHDQKAAVQLHARQHGVYSSIEFLKDYGGHHRVAVLGEKRV
jgi:release factor glutamine methyltransferase